MASDVLLTFTDVPFFTVEESYDTAKIFGDWGDSLNQHEGLSYAEYYMTENMNAIQTLPRINGYFMTSCMGHCHAAGYTMEDVIIGGRSLAFAYQKWYDGDARTFNDSRIIEKCIALWPPCNVWYADSEG